MNMTLHLVGFQTLYPTIDRLAKELYELPEVKASLPANQPDAPK
jgi:hypothetical protein